MSHKKKKRLYFLIILLLFVSIIGVEVLAGYLFEKKRDEKQNTKNQEGSTAAEELRQEQGNTEEEPRLSGMVRRNGKTYLYKEDGTRYKEEQWVEYEGDKYYVNSDGSVRVSQLFRAGDAAYYVDTVGRMVHGFFTMDGRLRYFEADGRMREEAGWLDLDGKRYYIDATAAVVTGKDHPIRNLSADGVPFIYGSQWCDPDVKSGKDWVDISEDSNAAAAKPSAGARDSDGEASEDRSGNDDDTDIMYGIDRIGMYTVNGKDYIFDENGVLLTGKISVDEYSFFFADTDGVIVKDREFSLKGLTYHADAEGRVFAGSMYEKAQEYGSVTDYLILCNLDTQRTAVFEGEKGNWKLLREMLVSSGAPINPTPKGEYQTTVHTEHFNSYGVRAWYATGFIGGLYLFHSSPYESASEPLECTERRLGKPLSHGCVRMRLEDSKWMYDRLPLRTKVVIYEE